MLRNVEQNDRETTSVYSYDHVDNPIILHALKRCSITSKQGHVRKWVRANM